ncbi:MAG TPA: GYF domain-containing protein [Pirellulales bacterium]|nr:GYF domain-containing protein [Pirellulales bacterium]
MNTDRFYIRLRGREQGPFDVDQLHSLSRSGQFSRVHEVSSDGRSWGSAKDRPELFPRVAPAPLAAAAAPASGSPGESESLAAEPADYASTDPDEEAKWFYARGGLQEGPTKFDQLVRLASAGALGADDLVWAAGMANWTPAREIRGLMPDAPPAPASPAKAAATPAPVNSSPASGAQTSGLAVASLVLGLLGVAVAVAGVTLMLIGLGLAVLIGCVLASVVASVLAVVFGHSAARQIKQQADRRPGGGMALAGMALGYVILTIGAAIVLLLAAMSLLTVVGVRSMVG